MRVDEAEQVRSLLREVDFPEPRHDVERTIRLGRRRKVTRWTAAVATGTAVVVVGAAAVMQLGPAWPGRTEAGPAGPPTQNRTEVATGCAITHLPLPHGVTSAGVTGVDPSGRYVIGFAENRTILWTDGQPQLLPPEAVGAEAVNPSGVVVGTLATGGAGHAWVYRDGKVDRLRVPPDSEAAQVSINAAGDVAGILYTEGTHNVPIVWRARAPGSYEIRHTPGRATVRGISDSGVVIGSIDGVGPYRWNADTSGQPLATLPGLADGFTIDVAGDWVTGKLQSPPDPEGKLPPERTMSVRWNLVTGRVTPLDTPALPVAVDPTGRVLIPENPPRLINPNGVTLLLPPDPGFHRMVAAGISDNGIIVGSAATDDKDPNAGPYRSQPIRWNCAGN